MDVLYYIGHGSHHSNRELRYSLRALETHCRDIDQLWIVGNKPHFLKDNIRYLWVEDSGLWWQNAFNKTMAAIKAGISEDFLLMNDDFYMLQDFKAAAYPYYHRGEIPDTFANNYQKVIVNTKKILRDLGKTVWHYGVHCPMRLNARLYPQLANFYQEPVSARCLYGNLFCQGTLAEDNKSTIFKNSSTGCFSSVNWVGNDIFAYLQKLFPTPSKWENGNV